jgi:hypothetical protein
MGHPYYSRPGEIIITPADELRIVVNGFDVSRRVEREVVELLGERPAIFARIRSHGRGVSTDAAALAGWIAEEIRTPGAFARGLRPYYRQLPPPPPARLDDEVSARRRAECELDSLTVWVHADAMAASVRQWPYHWTDACVRDDASLVAISRADAEADPNMRPCKVCLGSEWRTMRPGA